VGDNQPIRGCERGAVYRETAPVLCLATPLRVPAQSESWCPQRWAQESRRVELGGDTIERVCNIPLRPDADHRDMRKPLQMNFLSSATAAKHKFYPGRFGRLDYEGIFQICMTDITPCSKNAKVRILLKK
jgi:hypothetical protein